MTGGKFNVPDITLSNTTGVFPNDDDIALQSRGNTDVILKEGQIWIRAGKYKDTEERNQFNDRDLGYIQVKYGGNELVRTLEDKVITNYVYDKAETLVDVQIDTINSNDQVGNSLMQVLDNWETIFEQVESGNKYNKNLILAYIRELSGLSRVMLDKKI